MNYNRMVERMRSQGQPRFNSGIELSQQTEDIMSHCHHEHRGNKIVLIDNITGNILRVIPLPV